MIDRLPKEELPYFNSADQIIQQDDCIETDVRIAGWDTGKFRIRALNFGQMTKINRMAVARKDDEKHGISAGDFLNDEWAYWTLVEGIVRPKIKIEQARRFAENNGEFVKQLADEIWNIGRISKAVWDGYIKEISDANKIATDKTADVANDESKAEQQ